MSDHKQIANQLKNLRGEPSVGLPGRKLVEEVLDLCLSVLFPHFTPPLCHESSSLEVLISAVALKIESLCRPMMETVEEARDLSCGFINYLPKLHNMLRLDAEAILAGDPAANSIDEVILAYPGFVAIAAHRIAHWLLERKLNLIPRLISEIAHARTGIDIHPGAQIGQSFVIDHGTGIVIGETTVIKDNVKLYQGVTLGALSVKRDFINLKRHPTIESNVIIYANATILGGDTTIGENCIIGGNMWITRSIAPGTRIYRESDDSQLI